MISRGSVAIRPAALRAARRNRTAQLQASMAEKARSRRDVGGGPLRSGHRGVAVLGAGRRAVGRAFPVFFATVAGRNLTIGGSAHVLVRRRCGLTEPLPRQGAKPHEHPIPPKPRPLYPHSCHLCESGSHIPRACPVSTGSKQALTNECPTVESGGSPNSLAISA